MTKINNQTFGEALYDAPSISVLDVQSEGLLCVSGDINASDWTEGQTGWFENQ